MDHDMMLSNDPTALLAGDFVAEDSCIDLRSCEDFELFVHECELSYEKRLAQRTLLELARQCSKPKQRRELPPALPRSPWIMTRYYTSDGRLIIQNERLRHCKYFESHRSNGRLTLRLVPVNSEEQEEAYAIRTVEAGSEIDTSIKDDDVKSLGQESIDGRVAGGDSKLSTKESSSLYLPRLSLRIKTEGIVSDQFGDEKESSSSGSRSGRHSKRKCHDFNSLMSRRAVLLF